MKSYRILNTRPHICVCILGCGIPRYVIKLNRRELHLLAIGESSPRPAKHKNNPWREHATPPFYLYVCLHHHSFKPANSNTKWMRAPAMKMIHGVDKFIFIWVSA